MTTHTLHGAFEAQCRRSPDAVAVTGAGGQLTYAELDRRANGLAAVLREHGAGPDAPVGVLLDRSLDLVVGLLAVLKAGSPYLPLETEYPQARITRLLRQTGAVACLTTGARELDACPAVSTAWVGEAPAPPPDLVLPDHLAAIHCTSGSTGEPKAVACTHRGWLNRMRWMQGRHELRPGETVLHKTTLTFDDAAVEIFWPLLVGGRVALLAPGLHRDARAIIDAAAREHAVHLQFVPSVLALFLDELSSDLPDLRSVLSSGEALRPELVRRFRDRFGDRVSLDNTWGATEVSIDSTYRICTEEDTAGDGAVCVGVPMAGNEVRVVDENLVPVPDGVVGELVIGGIGLARGYLHAPAATAAAFVPDPAGGGRRLYRTGDHGWRRPDGGLMFGYRVDDQVKVGGVRVELGEVETALREHPDVVDAAARVWEPRPGDRRLAAYAVLRAGAVAGVTGLGDHLRRTLPNSMVPASIMVLDTLVRLSSGKLDRQALPLPALDTEAPGAEPRTLTERILTDIWSDVLGVTRLGVDDNFFNVGGHSLLAMRLLGRMRRAFETDALPLDLVFDAPTIAKAAARIEEILTAEISTA